MPATKVLKPKPVETARKTLKETRPAKVRAARQNELQVPAARTGRATSCPRCPRRDGRERRAAVSAGRESRARSSSTAAVRSRANPATASSGRHAPASPKYREMSVRPGPREPRGVRAETRHQSHRAFTVIPPDPKKRREIQRQAEAELAALEALRLSRAMAYVSIDPSSVGGCMSLEEVRLKQQQEMMQAKRKQKSMTKHS